MSDDNHVMEKVPASPPSKRKMTIGEELFLVHLKRTRSDDDEQQEDLETLPRSPVSSRYVSPGDELYHVHLKRSEGWEEAAEETKPVVELPREVQQLAAKPKASKQGGHTISLRSRQVPPVQESVKARIR